jgi:hypothetical protein
MNKILQRLFDFQSKKEERRFTTEAHAELEDYFCMAKSVQVWL